VGGTAAVCLAASPNAKVDTTLSETLVSLRRRCESVWMAASMAWCASAVAGEARTGLTGLRAGESSIAVLSTCNVTLLPVASLQSLRPSCAAQLHIQRNPVQTSLVTRWSVLAVRG
jgi:hypothetical protein